MYNNWFSGDIHLDLLSQYSVGFAKKNPYIFYLRDPNLKFYSPVSGKHKANRPESKERAPKVMKVTKSGAWGYNFFP